MMKKQRYMQIQYISLLSKTNIMPYKINVVHFFAYTNNSSALNDALKNDCAYSKDKSNTSPLDYAI
jgi:hypothetical protein